MSTPAAVRLLPMSDSDEDVANIETTQVQRNLFMRNIRLDGRYQYREHGLIAEPGTVVLFQLRNSVVASGIFEKREKFSSPNGEYTGALYFRPESVTVFKPLGLEEIRAIWPTFNGFGRTMANLEPAENYAQFEKATVPLWITAEEGAYMPDGLDTRERIDQSILARRGGREFRDNVIKRYGAQCLVTGSKILHILEAAHICPYRGEKDNDVTNGLLLRADVHTLFDLHLLGIRPDDLSVELHPDLTAEYGALAGQTLTCAEQGSPSADALAEQYKKFRERLMTKSD